MIAVTHVLDPSAGWAGRVAVEQLCRRLSRHQFAQTVLCPRRMSGAEHSDRLAKRSSPKKESVPSNVSGVASVSGLGGAPKTDAHPRLSTDVRIEFWEALPGPAWLAGPLAFAQKSLRQALKRDLIHVFSVDAAQRIGAVARQMRTPMVLTLQSPRFSRLQHRFLRQFVESSGVAIACSTHHVQRQIVEAGVPIDRTVVIRPAVDFAAIRSAKEANLRQSLGLPHDSYLIAAATPLQAGDLDAIWGAMTVALMAPQIRILAMAQGPHVQTLQRRVSQSIRPDTIVFIRTDVRFEDVVAASDLLLLGPGARVDVSAVPWAMASETLVVAVAGYDTAELIVHKVNGLLYKGEGLRGRITELTRLLKERDAPDRPRWLAAARTQAYDVFGIKRFADQTARLYHNLLENRPAADGIADAALVG